MPENHQFKTNYRAQDASEYQLSYLDDKVDSPGSESTESAVGGRGPQRSRVGRYGEVEGQAQKIEMGQ
jgi:hypothetical protein